MPSTSSYQPQENPVWSEARERYRQVPLGLQLCRFLFSTEPTKPHPVPGKPWVALVCDPNDKRFYHIDFSVEEPDGDDFEGLLLQVFERTKARPEFVEVDDIDVAIDIGRFCSALEIRIDVRDYLPMAEEKRSLIRNAIVAKATRRGDEGDDPEGPEAG